MAESVVSMVAENLGGLLQAKLLCGVRMKVKRMKMELELIKSYLKDADKRQTEDETLQAGVSDIREAAYDAEYVIETFVLKIESQRKIESRRTRVSILCALIKSVINYCKLLQEVLSNIEAIETRITTSKRWLDTHGIQRSWEGEEGLSSVVERQRQRQQRQSYSLVDEEYTVGLEGDIKNLVEQLLNEEKQCRVVSICGMGGLGKTTLAKKIYHHKDIKRHFDSFAWAFISQQCQPRNIWEGILFELISPSKEEREEILKYKDAEVAKKLYEVQQESKCLVILDDIWTVEAWESLRCAFPVGNASSKILLTTRNTEVALHVDLRGLLHKPRCLTEEEGWALLQKKAFPGESDGEMDDDMKKLGAEMVKRCGGLPLAIVVLGGILATKHKDEWKMVNNQIDSYLNRAKGHETLQLGVREILALSYYELPYQLKPCFLYLCHFPEDFSIPTKKLVRMWVAEGLVSPMQYKVKGAETLEEIAECYLGELLNRNMVQMGEIGSTGRVKTCRLHDLMRDLCLLKAKEENFLEIFDSQDGNVLMGDSLSSTGTSTKRSQRIHRIAILFKEANDKNIFLKSERTPYLRSLLFTSTFGYGTYLKEMRFDQLCDFKLLKVLDLEACTVKKLPGAIGDLVHLRYLNFKFYAAPKVIIPSSIGNLRYLQTLILNYDIIPDVLSIFEVPNIIWKMERLRHLCLPYSSQGNGVKLKLGNLRELQTLKNFDARHFDAKELTKLTNLRKLEILYLRSLKELEGVLSLNGLRSLRIKVDSRSLIVETDLQRLLSSCHQLCKLFLEGKIVKLPEYSKFPPNLTKLTLLNSQLKEDPMPTLEKLPNLTLLRLQNAFKGKQMTCTANGFPQLKSLHLYMLQNLEEWCVQEEAMRGLCKLEIRKCVKLKMVPYGLRFITALREIYAPFPLFLKKG